MHELKLIYDCLKDESIVSMEKLKHKMNFSERKIRQLLRDLRDYGGEYGFKVVTVVGKGYQYVEQNREKIVEFEALLQAQDQNFFIDKNERVFSIILLLLQNKNYISQQQIAEALNISRSTVLNDMAEVKKIIDSYHLTLASKHHYGIKLVGEEIHYRNLFSMIINSGFINESENIGFYENADKLDFSIVERQFKKLLHENGIVLSENAFDSIILHLRILVWRALNDNFITDIQVNKKLINSKIYSLANHTLALLQKNFQVSFTENEADLLAAQIYGKATSERIPEEEKEKQFNSLSKSLEKVDLECGTDFSEDSLLKEYLLFHIYPLILRISFGLELKNPVLPTISIKYSNSFLVALKFIEYHQELYKYKLSRDEIGYLALHFAAHQERTNQEKLNTIKRIVLITNLNRSQEILLKTKIQILFPSATIRSIYWMEWEKYDFQNVDLILTTAPIDFNYEKKPLFLISPSPSPAESEINTLKNNVLYSLMQEDKKLIGLDGLFEKKNFFFEKTEKDYLKILEKYSKHLVDIDYAQPNFPNSVLEREKRFTTIYEQGIAGPHSMEQNANVNSILVVILPEKIRYEQKYVDCIFLINIKSKQLFLHQEISELLLKIIENEGIKEQLSQTRDFNSFTQIIQQLR